MADCRDFRPVDEDYGIAHFLDGRQDSAGVNGCGWHGSDMLAEESKESQPGLASMCDSVTIEGADFPAPVVKLAKNLSNQSERGL